jgi:hypothetical protein
MCDRDDLSTARTALRAHGFADAEVNLVAEGCGEHHRHDGDDYCIMSVRSDWKFRYLTLARIVEGEQLAKDQGTTVMEQLFGSRRAGSCR